MSWSAILVDWSGWTQKSRLQLSQYSQLAEFSRFQDRLREFVR